ncbi:MAG: ammonium transporter [Candidatus Zambryskibacteria bacterium CG22_combo_CG10-13_8_21_14_all_42_17]|uniref:Ammonium transporter n=1 Tax=Candidatus Zambryskibacteria bacterium CG22_combo_CG10-13_8_21_14_all_42_17 TaxID=1975118 RepID=A0A2H0BD95_9BACT|nr:MAG: ammonium transporter [Candidatus Zambryskibacteria bacterium CG22_combo_CG10-13_8_21_14_all_42_17]
MELNTGSTAFMLVASALVMLMTPGLAFFYGGLVSRSNVVSVMMQSFASIAWTTFLWIAIGYSLTFSGDWMGIIGNLDNAFLRGVSLTEITSSGIPLLIFIAYQMMFAIITPALITGAFVGRIRFGAYMIFLTAWLLFVYFPIAHMVWGGGLFSQWEVLDFAGGTVVHAIAGFAALASVLFLGRRKTVKDTAHNLPFVALGTALLWFGWFGFNAGSELQVDAITTLAFLNTQIAAAIAALTWLIISWVRIKKPSFVGLLIGAVAGLVAITPAAGFVTPGVAILFGIIASLGCYGAVEFRRNKSFDDALDVWAVHGIGGVLGVIFLGIFASLAANPDGANGLIFGNFSFFGFEVLSVAIAILWSFVFTYAALWVINKFTPVRVKHEEEDPGLDILLHGEEAYIHD